jgi:hypothetical protein
VLDAISDPRLPIADVAALDFRVPDQIGLELKDQSEENRRRILMLLARSARPKGKEQL